MIGFSVFKRVLLYIILIFLAIWFLLPLYTDFTTAFKTLRDSIVTLPIQLPPNPTFSAMAEAFSLLSRPLTNSLIFTSAATVLSCLLGSIMGYLLTKVRFPGSNGVFLLLSVGIFIPYQVVIVPLVIVVSALGLYNTVGGLILVHTIYGVTITSLLFRNFYMLIPDSLVMAAKTDGAGTWTVYRRIILPLSVLPFMVAAVLQFTSIWNDFLFGVTLALGATSQPASVALANMKGTTTVTWNTLMAGALWYSLPVLIIYIVLGKYLVRGYMSGAVRG
jgi:glucose/mannose transport system permease protein